MKGGKLEVDPDEVAVVKYMFEANECYTDKEVPEFTIPELIN